MLYSFYTGSRKIADALSVYFKDNNIYYERSGCGSGFYFTVELTENQLLKTDKFLDRLHERYN